MSVSRFLAKVDKQGAIPAFRPDLGACWIWRAAKNSHGHGIFQWCGRLRTAHAASYEIHVGQIPNGLEIDHLCRVRQCVNPAHLEAVTHKENMRRGVYGMRTKCPLGHPYEGDNLYVTVKGARQCRACKALAMKRFYEARA